MAVEHVALAQTLGSRSDDILLVDFLKKRILGQHSQRGEATDHQGYNRQDQMPEIIDNLTAERVGFPIVGNKAAQRKPTEIIATREQHHEQH